jgi:hypothetical protein
MLVLLVACLGVNTARVPNQDIYADQGDVKEYKGQVGFAVVGDTRWPLPLEGGKRPYTAGVTETIVKDISESVQEEEVQFVVHLGDMVPWSYTGGWKRFSDQWAMALSGTSLNEEGLVRVRSLPVAGNHDLIMDKRLKGWGAAFQGAGADIGYNRVASWYFTDIVSEGHTWRLLVLDTNKDALGSRWREQLAWLETYGLKGDFDSILVFMHHPLITLGQEHPSNENGAPKELMAIVEDQSRVSALKAVFAGHNHTSEALLPGGRLGEMYITAGGGGGPADSLARWGKGDMAGFEDIRLEPIYDLALVKAFKRWGETRNFPEAIYNKGLGEGSYSGFTAVFDARYFPVMGWWQVVLKGEELELLFRFYGEDGKMRSLYSAVREPKTGWKIGQ